MCVNNPKIHKFLHVTLATSSIILIVALVAGFIICLTQQNKTDEFNPDPAQSSTSTLIYTFDGTNDSTGDQALDAIRAEVTQAVNADGITSGIAKWQEYIDATTDSAEKAKYYIQRAADLYNFYAINELDDASIRTQIFGDVYAAENLEASAATALAVSRYEWLLGDPATATYYDNLAAERNPVIKEYEGHGQG